MRSACAVVLAALLWTGDTVAGIAQENQTLAYREGAPVAIRVTYGVVEILGEARPDIAVDVRRRGHERDSGRLPLTIRSDQQGVSIAVEQTPLTWDRRLRAELTLRVPEHANLSDIQLAEGELRVSRLRGVLTAKVTRGSIEARQIEGRVRLETEVGDIAAEQARLSPEGLLRLRTFNGDVRLALAERPANARILLLALNGSIGSDIPVEVREAWGPRSASATLGRGEPLLSIDVVRGRIELRAPP